MNDLGAEGVIDGASYNLNEYDPRRLNSEHVGSYSRTREMADNLQAQFNDLDNAGREPSMPGSGGQGFDMVDSVPSNSGIGGGLLQKEQVTYSVDWSRSQDEFCGHMDESNVSFKEQLIKKVQFMQQKDLTTLNNKVSTDENRDHLKVDELKLQEGKELTQLNKQYLEVDARYKKKDRKVSH